MNNFPLLLKQFQCNFIVNHYISMKRKEKPSSHFSYLQSITPNLNEPNIRHFSFKFKFLSKLSCWLLKWKRIFFLLSFYFGVLRLLLLAIAMVLFITIKKKIKTNRNVYQFSVWDDFLLFWKLDETFTWFPSQGE